MMVMMNTTTIDILTRIMMVLLVVVFVDVITIDICIDAYADIDGIIR